MKSKFSSMWRVSLALLLALSLSLVMAVPVAAQTDGTLIITEDFVASGGVINIRVTDNDFNIDTAAVAEKIIARVISPTEGLISVSGEEVTGSATTYTTALPVDPGNDNLITPADFIFDNTDIDDAATAITSVVRNSTGTVTLTLTGGAADGDTIYDTITYYSAETVLLTETGVNTGIFEGTKTVETADNVGTLQIVDGGTITASYYDVEGTEGRADNNMDTATADTSQPTLDSATTTSTTTIDVVLSDTGSGLDKPSIAETDFVVTNPAVSITSIDIAGVTDGTSPGTVVLTTAAAFSSNSTPTVALTGDGIDDDVGNTQTTGSVVASDVVSPSLTSWDLDMNAKTASLTFDEPVNADTLDVTKVAIQSVVGLATTSRTLTSGSTTASANGTTIVIDLSATDFNALAVETGLATGTGDSWLTIAATAIDDMASNAVTVIPTTAGVQASLYVADTTSPSLAGWDLDMDAKTVSLTFDETVDKSTLAPSAVTIQDAATLTTSRTLTGGTTTSADGTTIVIDLTTADFDAIAADTGLATSTSDSYLTITATAIDDMNANDVTAIADGSGVQAGSYVADATSTSPNLLSWVLNMNAKTVSLTFDETVDASTLDVTAVTIQNAAEATTSYALTTGSTTTSADDPTIVIDLSATDFNALALDTGLATGTADSYLTITAAAIDDMTGNDMNPIADGSGVNGSYTADTTSPNLTSWDLDMNTKKVSLTLDETVDASSLNLAASAVTIQSVENSATISEALTDSTTSSANGTTIVIDLSATDFDAIAAADMATGTDDSWLTIATTAIGDMAGNAVTAIAGSAGVQADSYTADITSPTIISVETVDDNANGKLDGLKVTFSEAIVSAGVEADDFTIVSANGLSGVLDGTLTDTDSNDEVIVLDITEGDDYDTDATPTVKYDAAAGTADSIKDIAGNAVVTATTSAATDTAAPVIIELEAQLGSWKATVTFSEGVYTNDDGTGNITAADLTFTNDGTGAGAITSVSHLAGEDIAVVTLDAQVISGDFDGNPDKIAAASGTAIYDSADNAAGTTPVVDMADARDALSLIDGWNLVSIPKVASAGWDIPSNGLVDIYVYDNGGWSIVSDANSLDAIFINANGPQELALSWTTSYEAVPPTKALEAGWNLVGANMDPDVEISVQGDYFLDTVSGSYSTLFSPSYNLDNWTVTTGTVASESVLPYEGYWIYMEAVDTLAGRTS